jgi:hypothetical protein
LDVQALWEDNIEMEKIGLESLNLDEENYIIWSFIICAFFRVLSDCLNQ